MEIKIVEALEYDVNKLKSIESIGKRPPFVVAKGETTEVADEDFKKMLNDITKRYGKFLGTDGKFHRLKADLVKHIVYRAGFEIPIETDGELVELTKSFPKAIKMIFDEKVKQLNKGFDLEHDKDNARIDPDCLLRGALWYLLPEDWKQILDHEVHVWPYIDKPTYEGMLKNLVKGITMLIAHLQLKIDTLDNGTEGFEEVIP